MAGQNAETVREDGLDVSGGGRVTIPKHVRDHFDLITGRLVQIHLPSFDEHFSDAVGSNGRVSIPARIRNEHGIEDGDSVDVEISV